MNFLKRNFLTAGLLTGVALPALAQGASRRAPITGPGLLTVTGAIGRPNRGPFNPVLDQMMSKQKISFDKAHVFDFAALSQLKAITIKPTLEYDNKVHTLTGPLLVDVLKAAGAAPDDKAVLKLRAVDGYSPTLTFGEAREWRFIVATHIDGQPLHVGGLGPLWAVFDADRVAAFAVKPVDQRFAQCPWGLYHIEV